jgi:ankyrin repeat protein
VRLKCPLVIAVICVFGLLVCARQNGRTNLAEQDTNEEPQLDTTIGIPIWIMFDQVRSQAFPDRRVLVFLEAPNFSKQNLEKIFRHLSDGLKNPDTLIVNVRSDREKLQKLAKAYRHRNAIGPKSDRGIIRLAEDQAEQARLESNTDCLRADFIRMEGKEKFYYYPDSYSRKSITVVMKARSSASELASDPVADLMRATRGGLAGEVRRLLARGVDVNATDKEGNTALINASRWRQLEVVRVLLEAGADTEKKGASGWTALMAAIIMSRLNETELAQELIQRGADVNARGEYGETVLMLAIKKGHVDIVRVILKRGADLNAKNTSGQTALVIAEEMGMMEISSLLREAGANR